MDKESFLDDLMESKSCINLSSMGTIGTPLGSVLKLFLLSNENNKIQ